MDYATWAASMRGLATRLGVPLGSAAFAVTVWPPKFQDGHAGEPAIRLNAATYAQAFNANALPDAGTRDDGNGYVYVLAQSMTGDTNVIATSPHTMTTTERAANAAFTGMDKAADAVGLPDLSSIEQTLKMAGWIAAAAAAYLVLKRR